MRGDGQARGEGYGQFGKIWYGWVGGNNLNNLSKIKKK